MWLYVVDVIVWVLVGCCLRMGFRWSVEISWILEEQDGAVVGVFLPLPSGSASGPLSMHTSGSSYHTPAVDVIKWEWLVIFYLMDVFHEVYTVICTP